ncbi:D-3-phosphoglycerate dehydrogenase 2 [Lasiodiplodia hormozganensis]|uniref:D-3-phosphoglycerate dehydrogenase n=1 Tax=Lasiodiplodia hormozganensis TaxID=869390 RepID=A0AA39YFT1_9PEZI|nr:D-3-phosphoglycerate dehydrogenase 2 [Lasiodiplodia hormozganensis]
MSSNGAETPRPKVLIPEKVSPDGLALLRENFEVHERKGLSPDQLKEVIPDYEALIVRSETKVTADLLSAATKLKVVARAGVGVDNVDVETATKRGVIVVNSPSGNIGAAAEHTVALMMAVARNIGDACASLKSGKWERSRLVGVEMKGKTLAIVGAGKVGITVARIANGMGMNVIAYDPYANPQIAAAASVELKDSLDDLLTAADFFTIHTPLIASTRGMIGKNELSKMKPTARLLNVARGGVIDEAALLSALEAGTVAGAGIDVFTSEPPAPDSPAARLISHPKVVATPHLGASTVEAQENVSIDVCQQVVAILSGELPRSAVNAPLILPDEYRTLQPFVSLVEKMGSLYTQHYSAAQRRSPSAFRTTFDLTYHGHLAELNTTKPLFAALIKGLLAPISELPPGASGPNVNIVNAELVAKERGILVNERRARADDDEGEASSGFASSITLRARPSRGASGARGVRPSFTRSNTGGGRPNLEGGPVGGGGEVAINDDDDQVIQGFVSANTPHISRLDRFATAANFVPKGTMLICRNFDSCGKIGFVGNKLGAAGVNISSMIVAPLVQQTTTGGTTTEEEVGKGEEAASEALMILGVDGPVTEEVVKSLIGGEGVLEASVVTF